MKKLLIPFLVALTICACGPIYQTHYELTTPRSEIGKMCANNCLMAHTNCKQTCDIQTSQCSEIERLQAENDHQSYLLRQSREGRPAKHEMNHFYHAASCTSTRCDDNCQDTYYQCHTNCGGAVIPHTVCTAFCDEPQP